MDKDMIFFATDGQGLTSTSANHVANLAKEMIRGLESSLASLTLYATSVSLIGSETSDLLTQGAQSGELADVQRKLHTVAKAKSLIAWLREAIKAKDRLLKEAEEMTNTDYIKLKGLEEVKTPKSRHALTEDEYYASLSMNERNRYYELETLAAVLGKAIHPDGSKAVKASEVAAATIYANELDRFAEYNQRISAERTAYVKERVREIGDYKIIITDNQTMKERSRKCSVNGQAIMCSFATTTVVC